MQQDHPKRWYPVTKLHRATQKTRNSIWLIKVVFTQVIKVVEILLWSVMDKHMLL
jgi:hypothetical protein